MQFGVSKAEIPDDGSAKSRQLKYHRWIAQGRKDSDHPFLPTTDGNQPESSIAYLHAMLMDPHDCANCGTGDSFTCSGCLVTLDPQHVIFKTVYCSKKCQIAHWPKHRASCTSRKMIGRAGFLIRDLFIKFQALHLAIPITRVHESNGILYRFMGPYDEAGYKGLMVPLPFRREMALSEEHFQASMTAFECEAAFSTFKLIVDFFLLPLCDRIHEVYLHVRNAERPSTMMTKRGPVPNMLSKHTVMRVRLHSGEEVAIDPTCAQFGWQEPVSPWKAWQGERVYGPAEILGRGTNFATKKHRYIPGADDNWSNRITQFRSQQVERMLLGIIGAINNQQSGMSCSVTKFLQERSFEDKRLQITNAAQLAMETGLNQLRASKTNRVYWDSEGFPQVTTTPVQFYVLEKVWLSSDESEKKKNDVREMGLLWQQRCKDKTVVKAARKAKLNLEWH
ncbi:hypothetical protein PG988_007900 [Apiospora saccharicola]